MKLQGVIHLRKGLILVVFGPNKSALSYVFLLDPRYTIVGFHVHFTVEETGVQGGQCTWAKTHKRGRESRLQASSPSLKPLLPTARQELGCVPGYVQVG